ncbi:MAG: PDZ domain-containing protein [Elusimicrobia bacterium]|nr:PDZ domain-containing protein [Elusimicrobiota bacterium]
MMTHRLCAVLALSLAVLPASAAAESSDAVFSSGLSDGLQLLGRERALGRGNYHPATEETGPNDPILLRQAPLIALIGKAEPSVVVLVTKIPASDTAGGGGGEAMCAGFFVDAGAERLSQPVIATNSHCVEMRKVGDTIDIGLFSGNDNRPQMVKGRVLAYGDSNAAKDVAFVALEDPALARPSLKLWDKLDVGEEVVAIGNPRGFLFSVSRGIVSALGRDTVESQFVLSADQTDAAVNPGNSGGPLLNMWGSVVGINAMIASESGGSEGLSFTVPARFVRLGLEQFARTGDLKMGVMQVSLAADSTLRVKSVVAGGPAAQANILAGDQITAVDGQDLSKMDPADALTELLVRVKFMSPGETVTLDLNGDGKARTARVTLGEPAAPKWAPLPKLKKRAPKKSDFVL